MSKRYVQPLRIAIQWGFLLFMVYLGVRLFLFVSHFRTGGAAPFVPRADGVEGFLPIAGLLGVKDWVESGVINPIHPASVVIFVTVVAVSLLLKRSFCSWICPVGTLSELFWKRGFVLFKRNIRPPRWLDVALRGIKYLLLLFFLYSILWAMTPEAATAFIHSDYNAVADVRLLDFFLHLSGIPLAVIAVLLVLSLPVRNPFCRYLCPYGALLGLVSVLSPVKVTREKKTCVSCGVCTQVCPSYIPVMSKERVMSEECVGCWRCVSHCRAMGALEMKLAGRKVAVNAILFAALVVLIVAGGSLVGRATENWKSRIPYAEYMRLLGLR
ncbi:4Fe-4S ferredoxin iron-sulfur binding domain protein [Geobacter metallireducens RCH3]|uniref:Iron-sulfur cluster-binding oxidoreductase n=1 Tax=Geobacter metallireducens (strain ATCC 53774 / DSM 7210 / GS-15) TaxID=269799 RepID=Q39QC6_GEOMG|nr:4Fe-4S binding protein [Geobacter metallireducens]ABB33548.2 iron-sulfur cluster-binding oxidoreductase [Geobacter metallireducens GS-15]EHP87655.1 4Fe-4S ferredoxin iron-sulfur binding domain protein [Geobacter metallireducens RCH3]